MSDLRMVDGSLLSSVVKVGMYFSKQKCHNLGGKMFIFLGRQEVLLCSLKYYPSVLPKSCNYHLVKK